MLSTVIVPEHYDTRETFRAKFAAAYDSREALMELISGLLAGLDNRGIPMPLVAWGNGSLADLRELALETEHLLYAIEEWRRSAWASSAAREAVAQ